MSYKTCENCGCRIYKLGCVNCDEINYIEEQSVNNYFGQPLPQPPTIGDSEV